MRAFPEDTLETTSGEGHGWPTWEPTIAAGDANFLRLVALAAAIVGAAVVGTRADAAAAGGAAVRPAARRTSRCRRLKRRPIRSRPLRGKSFSSPGGTVPFSLARKLGQSPQEMVVDVQIAGNKSLPLNKILPHIRTRTGRPFDLELIQEDVRRLDHTHLFVNVKTYWQQVPGGRIVIFDVLERPLLQGRAVRRLQGDPQEDAAEGSGHEGGRSRPTRSPSRRPAASSKNSTTTTASPAPGSRCWRATSRRTAGRSS